jgi:hypothetical protein
MNSKYAILLSTVVFPGIVQSAALDGYVSYSSVAHARHSSDVLYGERHVLLYREGRVAERVVLDTCRYGSAFRREFVSAAAIRERTRLAPCFTASAGVRRRSPDRCLPLKGSSRMRDLMNLSRRIETRS